uniref:Uncharacterized protein n=1 Tax=Strongyloides papillosus TaxID=174720 RepID=A0A0N5BXN8_STREA
MNVNNCNLINSVDKDSWFLIFHSNNFLVEELWYLKKYYCEINKGILKKFKFISFFNYLFKTHLTFHGEIMINE